MIAGTHGPAEFVCLHPQRKQGGWRARAALVLALLFVPLVAGIPGADARSDAVVGRVCDVQGLAVSHARVRIRPVHGGLPSRQTLTDAAGRFQIHELPDGLYHLDVDHDSFPPWSDTLPLGTDERDALEIILRRAGDEPRAVEFLPRPDARLSGQVCDEAGIPVEGAVVVLGREFSVTDEAGRYHFARLSVGESPLRVQAAGYETLSGWPKLLPGAQTLDLKLERRQRFATVRGRVRVRHRPAGRVLPPLKVIFGARVVSTDAQGTFQLSQLPTGNHHVSILYNGRELWTDVVTVDKGESALEVLLDRLR